MGQNFLLDSNVCEKIKNLVLSENNNSDILEIGPGLGAISIYLKTIKANNYKAIEIDKRLHEHLINKKIFTPETIVRSDALEVDWDELFDSSEVCLVGNLPYSISSPLISKFINSKKFKKAILMLQLEMANRIAAKISSKDYNGFTVYVQSFTEISKNFIVKSDCFFPKPNVESCIVTITKKDINNLPKVDPNIFKNFLSKAFSQRRKTLFNNLKNFYPKDKVTAAIKTIKKELTIRPQELSPEEFAILLGSIYEN